MALSLLGLFLVLPAIALQNKQTQVVTLNVTEFTEIAAEAPLSVEIEKNSIRDDSQFESSLVEQPKEVEVEDKKKGATDKKTDTKNIREAEQRLVGIRAKGIIEDEIESEHRRLHWPLWVVVSLWVLAIPAAAMLALMLFAGLAILFNGWWQKREQQMEKTPTSPSKMLPDGWAVHLNDEGSIYYVHKSGRSTWEFPTAEIEENSTPAKGEPAKEEPILT